MNNKKNHDRDCINVVVADVHSGSDRAAVPPKIVLPPLMADQGNRTIRGTKEQVEIYTHLMNCGSYVKDKFPNHKKIVTINGDAIEGLHHRTIQLAAPTIDDHIEIHLEIMRNFFDRIGFSVKNGDEINYVSGTEAHTGYSEAYISGRILGEFDIYSPRFYDTLKLRQNGKSIWFTHQWVNIGNGHSEGNSINAALKNMYYNSLKEKWEMPDYVIGSHYHKSGIGSYSQNWKTYYGAITPSLQRKTRFAHQVTAFQRNDIGIILIEVTKNGLLNTTPLLMNNHD